MPPTDGAKQAAGSRNLGRNRGKLELVRGVVSRLQVLDRKLHHMGMVGEKDDLVAFTELRKGFQGRRSHDRQRTRAMHRPG